MHGIFYCNDKVFLINWRKSGINYKKIKWIKVIPPLRPIDPLSKTLLDAGEATVIGLARELGADFVLIDERVFD